MWNVLAKLFAGGASTVIDASTGLVKTIWGDRSAKDAALASEQRDAVQQFAAEFIARQQRTWWDSFVDGLNRLPRPLMVFGVMSSFIWPAIDPVGYVEYIRALQLIPDQLWLVCLTVFGFFFGGRIIENAPKAWKVDPKMIDLARQLAADREARRRAETITTPAQLSFEPEKYNTGAEAVPAEAWAEPDRLPPAVPDDDQRVLAATIWGEARGEPREGKIAVAWVIRNRVHAPGWWGSSWRTVCLAPHQFSCWWDQQAPRVRSVSSDDPRFAECFEVAGKVMAGNLSDPTRGADHYYADTIEPPRWARGRQPTIVIGRHLFFRIGLTG